MAQQSSGAAAYDALIAAIRSGTYAPGARLREVEVGNRLSLSRTPIREALRRLEAEGIVEHRPRLGAVVRRLSHSEVVELYEMRIVLEQTAAEMAAKHGGTAEFETLADINRQIAEERDNVARAAALNQEFHRGLYLACRNRFLVEAAQGLNNALLLLGPTTFTNPERIERVVEQHAAIIEALVAGDAGAAGAAAAEHLETSLRYRLRALSS